MGITTPPPSPREVPTPNDDDASVPTYDDGYAPAAPGTETGGTPAPVATRGIPIGRRRIPAPVAPSHRERAGPRANPAYGEKIPCSGRHDGEFKKIPSTEHHGNMRAHVRNCTREDCRQVWTGPWGSFIGGAEGRTHFDLTDCREGKRLNELIGWSYDDPRR